MDNKGQSLVVFVLLLPVVTLLIMALACYGDMLVTKNHYENSIKSVLKYGLDNLDDVNIELKLNNLLKSDIPEGASVSVDGNVIRANVSVTLKNNFSKIFNNNNDINISYVGYLENDKKIIKKE